ncbi:molybdenum ABC transporter ATP-binding protein [Ramlibacter sp.]|uniref:molybdenum ABC transporter ATP-binding protein n=1 Tax=Ramlibacter sp. TaxID=1917967 RepID=UPI003D0A0B64
MSADLRVRVRLARDEFTLDVDLALPAHGISVLFGPSGSGKTSILRCVAGLERSVAGRIEIGGETWLDDAARIDVPAWRRELGYVFQEASLFEHLGVQGNLEYGLRRAAKPGGRDALEAAVRLLGIGHLLAREVSTLSGGERQRVAIARALATQPRLLLLDEPLSALDRARRQEVLPWLEKMRDELSVPMLYVTHSADEAARLGDRLVLLEAGRVRAAGAAADLLAAIDGTAALGDDVGALVAARIVERDEAWGLVRAEFDAGSFWIADHGLAAGAAVRLRVHARDVSIQLEEPTGTSIQNHVRATVEAIADASQPSQAYVRLACGRQRLVARVTKRAVHALGLSPGIAVWAAVKAVAVVD